MSLYLWLILALFIIQPSYAQTPRVDLGEIYRAPLPSGMRLVIAPRPESPLTTLLLRVRVGSGAETPETNGLAHLIEHMVFKGGEERQPGDLDRAMESLGGEFAARTTRDFTEFSVTVPSESAPEALKRFGQLIGAPPAFREKDLEQERAVVLAEIAAAGSDPIKLGFQAICATLFEAGNPYRLPLTGSPENVRRFTPGDLRRFWQSRYRPENMTLVTVGKVDPVTWMKAAESIFPGTPASSAATAPTVTVFVTPGGIVRAPQLAESDRPSRRLSTLFIGFRAPAAEGNDTFANLEVLMPLLAYGKGGRLYSRLVEKDRLALALSADFIPGKTQSFVLLTVTTLPALVPRLEKALEDEIRRIREDGIKEAELAAARAAVRNRARYLSETVEGQARWLAQLDQYNPEWDEERYLKQVDTVTAESLRAHLIRYLTPLSYAVALVGPPPPGPESGEASGDRGGQP